MPDIGQNIESLSSLDSSLSVGASTDDVNGTSKDIGVNTSAQPVTVSVQFSITNAAANDGHDLDIRVQFSDDDTNWPDAGFGTELGNFTNATLGADLALSNIISFVPLLRYFRFQYDNNNATDAVTVDSEVALNTFQLS